MPFRSGSVEAPTQRIPFPSLVAQVSLASPVSDQQPQDPAGEGERQGRQEAVFCFKQKTQSCFLYKIKEGNQKRMPTFEL